MPLSSESVEIHADEFLDASIKELPEVYGRPQSINSSHEEVSRNLLRYNWHCLTTNQQMQGRDSGVTVNAAKTVLINPSLRAELTSTVVKS